LDAPSYAGRNNLPYKEMEQLKKVQTLIVIMVIMMKSKQYILVNKKSMHIDICLKIFIIFMSWGSIVIELQKYNL
jgi:hypothetical protein